jgi:hypothetical protein
MWLVLAAQQVRDRPDKGRKIHRGNLTASVQALRSVFWTHVPFISALSDLPCGSKNLIADGAPLSFRQEVLSGAGYTKRRRYPKATQLARHLTMNPRPYPSVIRQFEGTIT